MSREVCPFGAFFLQAVRTSVDEAAWLLSYKARRQARKLLRRGARGTSRFCALARAITGLPARDCGVVWRAAPALLSLVSLRARRTPSPSCYTTTLQLWIGNPKCYHKTEVQCVCSSATFIQCYILNYISVKVAIFQFYKKYVCVTVIFC